MERSKVDILPVRRLLLPVIVLAFAVRLYGLDTQSLWFDEIITVALARLPWYEGVLGLLGQGIQLTPLFHWLTKLWLTIGDSDWLLRFPAVVTGVLTVPLIFKLGQRYFTEPIGLIAALIFALNPYQVWYAQELKLYVLLPLCTTGAMIAFDVILETRGKRGWKALILFNIIGFAAHYFVLLVTTVQFLYLILTFKRNHRLVPSWTVAQVVAALPLVPWWGFIVWRQHFAIGIGQGQPPDLLSLWRTIWNFSFGYTGVLSSITLISLGVMLIGLGFGIQSAWHKLKRGRLIILWLFFPLLITLLLSFGRISFYRDRYLFVVTPALILLTVAGLFQLRPFALQLGLTLLFVMTTGFGLWQVYLDPVNFSKEDWRALAHTLDHMATPASQVVTCTDGQHLAFEYYNPHKKLTPHQVIMASEVMTGTAETWIIVPHTSASGHNLASNIPPVLNPTSLTIPVSTWQSDHFQSEISVAGLTAYHYKVDDPQYLPQIINWHCNG